MALGDYIHVFRPAASGHGGAPLLLLPRTGGDETTLLELGAEIAPRAALLSLRGNVLEDDKPRFFTRVARGQFDIADFRYRTRQLAAFIRAAMAEYGIPAPVAVGHSNGANIAWSVVMSEPQVLAGAVLFRPMMPILPEWACQAKGFPVLVTSGADDAVVPLPVAAALPAYLGTLGADVTHKILPATHDLVAADRSAASAWLASTFGK